MKQSDVYEVRESALHGSGAFAKIDIPRGQFVAQYQGPLVSAEESERIFEEGMAESGTFYTFQLTKDWDLDGGVPWNPAGKINHSCEPNLEVEYVRKPFTYVRLNGDLVEVKRQIWLRAFRDIKQGEELFFNYGVEFDPEFSWRYRCLCGTKSCPGFICDDADWPKLKKQIPKWREQGLIPG